MKLLFRSMSILLMLVYVGDLLLKKFFSTGFYQAHALPETGSYLALFFAVGFFLLSIYNFSNDTDPG